MASFPRFFKADTLHRPTTSQMAYLQGIGSSVPYKLSIAKGERRASGCTKVYRYAFQDLTKSDKSGLFACLISERSANCSVPATVKWFRLLTDPWAVGHSSHNHGQWACTVAHSTKPFVVHVEFQQITVAVGGVCVFLSPSLSLWLYVSLIWSCFNDSTVHLEKMRRVSQYHSRAISPAQAHHPCSKSAQHNDSYMLAVCHRFDHWMAPANRAFTATLLDAVRRKLVANPRPNGSDTFV